MARCKSKRRLIPAICAWFLLITCTVLFASFLMPYLIWTYTIVVPIVQGIIFLFVLTNFSLATFMDPGVIPKASPDEDNDDDYLAPLYKNVDINGITIRMKWCCTCQFYRPPRCSHCSVCNTCIETFDHHCPWVNNCIGRRNYRHFFFFLIFLSIHMITIFIWCLLYVLDHKNELRERDSVIALVILGIIIILFIPIIGLTGFHVILVARGRTTNEQVTDKFKGAYNPFSRGCMSNYCNILCGPVNISYVKHKKAKCKKEKVIKGKHADNSRAKAYRAYVDEEFKLLNPKKSKESSDPKSSGKSSNRGVSKSSNGHQGGDVINLERLDGKKDSNEHGNQSREEPDPSTNNSRKNNVSKVLSSSDRSVLSNNLDNKALILQECGEFNLSKQHEPTQESSQVSSKPYMSSSHHSSSQSQIMYHNHHVTMRRMDNGKTETTFSVVSDGQPGPSTRFSYDAPESSNCQSIDRLDSPSPSETKNHYALNTTPKSPSRSSKLSEEVPKYSSDQNHYALSNSDTGGLVIYYSPDSGNHGHQQIGYSRSSSSDLKHDGKTSEHSENSSHPKHYTKRPPSFTKALELSSQLENAIDSQKTSQSPPNRDDSVRQSQYEMNYEISV